MKENVWSAIIATVSTCIQEEAKGVLSAMLNTFSPWKVFGLREPMRRRILVWKRIR